MQNPTTLLLSLSSFALALALTAPSPAEAQLVLESGGVQLGGRSQIEIRSTTGQLEVREVLARATSTGFSRGYGGRVRSASAQASAYQGLCQTPCRLELRRPMELEVASSTLRLVPDGGPQNYLIKPRNTAGYLIGMLSTGFGISGLLSGGILIGIDMGVSERGNDRDMLQTGLIMLGAGSLLTVLGIVVSVASRGRVQRVDGFNF